MELDIVETSLRCVLRNDLHYYQYKSAAQGKIPQIIFILPVILMRVLKHGSL